MIQLDEGGAELGICHGGRLLLDYRPGGHTNAENVADVVAQHLSRVQRYLERYHSYLKSPLRHVYLAGDAGGGRTGRNSSSSDFKQFQVSVLDPAKLNMNWQHAADAPGPETGRRARHGLVGRSEPTPSSKPEFDGAACWPSRASRCGPILIRSLLPVAAVLLVAAGLFALFLRERIDTNALRAELDELDPVRTRARELRLKLTAAEAKLAATCSSSKHRLPQAQLGPTLDAHHPEHAGRRLARSASRVRDAKTASLSGC